MGVRNRQRKRKPAEGDGGWVRAAASLAFLVAFFGAGIAILARPPEPEPETVTTIQGSARAYGLDPRLVEAVIACESGGRSNAVSRAGAVGLMQVMPATGKWIARHLNRKAFSRRSLFNPLVSIRFGCWYLKYLFKDLAGDVFDVVAAYNGGQGNVKKWKRRYGGLEKQAFLEKIPFDETRRYVKKVMRSYLIYRRLYCKTVL